MEIIKAILPKRLKKGNSEDCIEFSVSDFTDPRLIKLNEKGYGIYYHPNKSSKKLNRTLQTNDIDLFEWLFIDYDYKFGGMDADRVWREKVEKFPLPPTKIVETGGGFHVYWKVSGLTKESFSSLMPRLITHFDSDIAVKNICQAMRLEGFKNTKDEKTNPLVKISSLSENNIYSTEDFDKILPILDKTSKELSEIFEDNIPIKFTKLLKENETLRELYESPTDRSKADYRIALILRLADYTREEVLSVINSTEKGQERGPKYASGIVNKVFTEEIDVFSEDYSLAIAVLRNDRDVNHKMELIKRYRLEKDYKQTLDRIEEEKKRGIYSTLNTKEIRKKNYFETLKIMDDSILSRRSCITDKLTDLVPIEGIEVILIAGLSGKGKSSTACNITQRLLQDKKKVLYISTEERAEDIMLRLVALDKNWNLADQRSWLRDPQRIIERNEAFGELIDNPNLLIIDSYTIGTDKITGEIVKPLDLSCRDHFELALNSVERDGLKFDVIIVDYISKIGSSSEGESEWQTIFKTAKFIEEWCKRNLTPAIVLSQLKDIEGMFENRLPGSKRILQVVTCAIELDTDYQNSETTWICHKNRRYGTLWRHTLKFVKGKFIDFEE